MAGRPPIDLNQKVCDLLTHTVSVRSGTGAPISNFEERTNACLNLIKYIDDHISTQSVYRASYDRHMPLLHRMVLVSLVEAFESFIKETAVVCVDAIAPFTLDNRFDQFSPPGGSLAAQFNAGSVGKAMCESETWLGELLPDRWLAAHPEHRLELRATESQSKAQSKRINRAKRRKALQRARAR